MGDMNVAAPFVTELALLCLVLSCAVLVRGSAPPPRLIGERSLWRAKPLMGTASPRVLLPVLGMVGAVLVSSPVLAVCVPLVAGFVRRELWRRRRRLMSADRADAAVGFVQAATSGLRAGRSLTGAVLGAAVEGGSSETNVLRDAVAGRVQAGRPFALAIDDVLGDGSVDERLIATTMCALDATGASAGAALERVSEALGERQSSREDARTQAQHALSSAGVLAALPFVFGAAAALAEPDVARLYASTWLGAACVCVALVLIFGSWEWLQRLLGSSS